ncbi:uncharacterized protein LOC113312690 [Papaver somniferum]|uniref:uncharacterized protein LOC113312690 n=1 Tax=Papaver somniferum TaxID=3469 RepID=UPI000E6F8E26|nr:uncharacterized protein LOC113312690 [Papaver somniferum]
MKVHKKLPSNALLDQIRNDVMKMMSKRRNTGKSFIAIRTPKNEAKLKAHIDEGLTWMVIKSDAHVCEVEGGESSHSANLEAKTCTCQRWRVYGFQCVHAFASITMRPPGRPPANRHLSSYEKPPRIAMRCSNCCEIGH